MAYQYQTITGRLLGPVEDRFTQNWRNPSWWNLLIVMPWALGLAFCVYEWRADSNIAVREKTATGIITAHEPSNHDRYGYTFVLDGKSYSGWEIPEHADPVIGQQVLVYYDPNDPAKNALTDFDELSIRSLGPLPFTVLGIGTVALVIFFRRRQFRRENVDRTR